MGELSYGECYASFCFGNYLSNFLSCPQFSYSFLLYPFIWQEIPFPGCDAHRQGGNLGPIGPGITAAG